MAMRIDRNQLRATRRKARGASDSIVSAPSGVMDEGLNPASVGVVPCGRRALTWQSGKKGSVLSES
jgi:hypothetical protein